VKVEDIAGFIKIVATVPEVSTLIKGDMFLALDTNRLTICTVSAETVIQFSKDA